VRTWLGEVDYSEGQMNYKKNNTCFVNQEQVNYKALIEEAKENLIDAVLEYKHKYGKALTD